MVIAMCCTKDWNYYLEVALFSLLFNNNVKSVYLFLENDDLKNKYTLEKRFNVKINIINYKKIIDKYISPNNDNRNTVFSDASLVRLFISKVILEEKIIYFDTDAVCLGDITELWETNINNYYVAGVLDENISKYIDYLDINNLPDKCINSGIIVMNLKKIRLDKKDDEFLQELNSHVFRFPDQDIINKTCYGKIKFLDNKFNSSYSTEYSDKPKVIHYAGYNKSDWLENLPYSHFWYEYEKKYRKLLD